MRKKESFSSVIQTIPDGFLAAFIVFPALPHGALLSPPETPPTPGNNPPRPPLLAGRILKSLSQFSESCHRQRLIALYREIQVEYFFAGNTKKLLTQNLKTVE